MDPVRQTYRPARSLEALAALAMRYTNAAGCALYEVDAVNGSLIRRACCGSILEPEDCKELLVLGAKADGTESLALRSGDNLIGVLVFTFSPGSVTPEKRRTLERSARIVEGLLSLFRAGRTQAQLAARIGELEADLADEKIADRVGGLLQDGNLNRDSLDTIERHVHRVLEAQHLSRVLEQLLRDLEDRIAERSLMTRAKALLRNRTGMSEHEAYVHLRSVSRRTRKRMGDVARQFIEEASSALHMVEQEPKQN
jgi:hypothetical protein